MTRLSFAISAVVVLTTAVCQAQTPPAGGPLAVITGPPERPAGEPPAEVHAYVKDSDAESISVAGPIAIGRPLPDGVTVRAVPQHEAYEYSVVNKRRVIIDAQTHKVIKIFD